MAHALIALGANLGARAEQLGKALDELSRLPESQLLRRSGWFETPPIGGPVGQGAFLNGAALLETALAPARLLAELQRIEDALGRVRTERWGARVIDLDLLLYDRFVSDATLDESSPGLRPGVAPPTATATSANQPPGGARGYIAGNDSLIVPHPRMAFRRFVLEPAAAVALEMVHPPSGWTVAALLDQLLQGANVVAVLADGDRQAEAWAERLCAHFRSAFEAGQNADALPQIETWAAYRTGAGERSRRRPKLILNFSTAKPTAGPAFHEAAASRRMPNLPIGGPVAWISQLGAADPMTEAAAAIQAVWPELAAVAPPSD